DGFLGASLDMPDQADTGHRARRIAGGRRATEKVLFVKVRIKKTRSKGQPLRAFSPCTGASLRYACFSLFSE
ncbi:MAG: hypothetical protein RBS68_16225, partial [Anaerolineales bacterium]|nr:hypothetical protein [Anaerolineales bacterium]